MRVRGTLLAIGLATPAGAQIQAASPQVDRVAEVMSSYKTKTFVNKPCPVEPTAEIIVCGQRSQRDRQRLPLPELNAEPEGTHIVRGEVPRAATRPVKQGSCGVVQGQTCNGGLDALAAASSAVKIIHKLFDPDWAPEEPPVPRRFRNIAP